MKKLLYLSIALTAILASSCLTDSLSEGADSQEPTSNFSKTRAIPTPEFDWENTDWMPTPSGQSRIPAPWVGAGSLASFYEMDIINDRYKTAGWELLYSTFDPNAPGPLQNPYFVLYNKYRGTIRFYLYLTTQFVASSSFLQDGISVVSNQPTSLLNFLGNEVIDATAHVSQYDQIQQVPSDGSSPLATNRWYMMQYEMAYDSNLASIPYNQIQLKWYLNYCNVQAINLTGTQEGDITGIIGATIGSSGSGVLSQFKSLGKATGTSVLAGIGVKFITDNEINAKTGENKLGLNTRIFQSISSGLKSALSGSITSLPGTLFNGLSAIFGSNGNQPIPVNLQFASKIELKGNISEKGSFPASPISFWIPGTNIASDAVGYIPLYNKSIGVINFSGKPKIQTRCEIIYGYDVDPYDGSQQNFDEYYMVYPESIDYSKYLIINPEVKKIADVIVKQQDLIGSYSNGSIINPKKIHIGTIYHFWGGGSSPLSYPKLGVRFTIEVKPKNGDAISTIIKTFKLEEERTEVII
ncbi:hypothetical protein [Alistipes sp.]|uniref:hypothetical protein n=1 Tax=Alistipes sp. TaxID=1872444 RepID=UPI003AF0CC9D